MSNKPFQPAVDYGVYLAVRVLMCIVQMMRLETCARAAEGLATVFHRLIRVRRHVIDENLRHAYPELSPVERAEMAWQMWRHLFLMVTEIAHARRKIHATNWRKHVRLVREKELVQGMLDERPAVLVTGHFGNFELAGYLLGMFGLPTVTVARTLDNPYLDRFLNDFRGATGQYMVPKDGSAKRIARYLDHGASLTLLGDQAAGPKGCWINFFGRPASAHKAIAVFALGHRGPLLVTYGRRVAEPMFYETGLVALADPADAEYKLDSVPELTQWFSDRLEEVVRQSPEQYWWVHRRWKGEPARRRKRQKAA